MPKQRFRNGAKVTFQLYHLGIWCGCILAAWAQTLRSGTREPEGEPGRPWVDPWQGPPRQPSRVSWGPGALPFSPWISLVGEMEPAGALGQPGR